MTDTDIRVSVVTPTFNMADRLPRCIESITRQSYPHVEHIVIDGGSSDSTVEYLQRRTDIRWISEPDSGQSDAINKGFRMAGGDLLTWLNADDTLLPDAVASIVSAARSHPESGLIYGDIEVVKDGTRKVLRPPRDLGLTSFQRGNVISQPGTFFTRWALDRVGLIDETFHLTMDFELWLRIVAAGIATTYVPSVLASFEVHGESKTGSVRAFDFAEEEARALQKHGQPHSAAMAIDRWFWDQELNGLARLLASGQYAEARRRAHADLSQLHPVISRSRLFLWAARLAPRLARSVTRFKRSTISWGVHPDVDEGA